MATGVDYWVWYDDEAKNSLTTKIDKAVGRYQEKYGELPRECKFNGNMIEVPAEGLIAEQSQFPGVQVLTFGNIPANNFWLGPVPQVLIKKA